MQLNPPTYLREDKLHADVMCGDNFDVTKQLYYKNRFFKFCAVFLYEFAYGGFSTLLRVPSGPRWLGRYSDSLGAGRSGDRIPVGGEIFRTCKDRTLGPPSLLYNG